MGISGITLFTSSECCLDCIYCITRERRKAGCYLSFEAWQNVILQAKDMGAGWIIFAGPGEPLLGKTALGLIEYASSLSMKSIVFTNGVLLNVEIAEFLRNKNTRILLKTHSFKPKIHDFLAGKQNPVKWVDYEYSYKGRKINHPIPYGLKCLLDELLSLSPSKRRNFICLESVLTKYNIDCVVDTALFAVSHGLDFMPESLISMGHDYIDDIMPSGDEYEYLYRKLKKIFGLRFFLNQKNTNCHIRNNPVIWENGDMALCFIEKSEIGNVQNIALKKLWQKRTKQPGRKLKIKSIYGFRNCSGREWGA